MKSNLIILFIVLLIIACVDSNSSKELNAAKNVSMGYPKSFVVNRMSFLIYLGSDNHEYYVTKTAPNIRTALHYPGCPKHTTYK